ncbi:SCP-like protein [Oesophagostomum dentatum]|uniref:SCP-like protein n=1 Tax=Oesophagostomum dentatum TaxID=61180 RepID=A0A0B1TSX6_OESDE|nr:SCP-like protein [Oesophagostomum dentatum]
MNDEFIKQIINSHNARRRVHGVPDLRWNDQLAAQAQAWAERVARQAYISYRELSGIGENITFFPRDLDPEAIVEHWYEEHEKYEYDTPGWQCGTNYFTQVIWRETEEVLIKFLPSSKIHFLLPCILRVGIGRAFVDSDPENSNSKNTRSSGKLAAPGDQVIVAFYRPAGNNNRAGQFAVNVLKPIRRDESVGIGRAFVDSDPENSNSKNTRSSGKLAAPGDQVIVAFYRPAGNNNRAGQFAVNVLKPIRRDESVAE